MLASGLIGQFIYSLRWLDGCKLPSVKFLLRRLISRSWRVCNGLYSDACDDALLLRLLLGVDGGEDVVLGMNELR